MADNYIEKRYEETLGNGKIRVKRIGHTLDDLLAKSRSHRGYLKAYAVSRAELERFVRDYGLAMDADDIAFCQDYFRSERRDPTITEIRVLDTYWSDHCRHTTFLTSPCKAWP